MRCAIQRTLPKLGYMDLELPSLEELRENSYVVRLPLRVMFRGVVQREALLIQGPAGWGEFSPFLEYGPQESANWLAAGIESAYLPYPDTTVERIPVNATLPAVTPEQVSRVLGQYDAPHTIKIKVAEAGQILQDDIARVAETRRLYPDAKLRVDANAGWTVEQAVGALSRLSEYDLEYAEQPVPEIADLARLRERLAARGVQLKIAADESVRKRTDPLEVARMGAADLMVIKAQPLGGIRAALGIVQQAGLDAVVSSALDTSVGLGQGAALAASLPELKYACGLSTGTLYKDDVTEEPLIAKAGYLEVTRPVVSKSKIRHYSVEPDCHEWWMERLEDSYGHLARRAGTGSAFAGS